MIIELRTYKTKPGKRADFLATFHTKTIPAHAEIGMKILGPLKIPTSSSSCAGFLISRRASR
jgi:hypothetical protein